MSRKKINQNYILVVLLLIIILLQFIRNFREGLKPKGVYCDYGSECSSGTCDPDEYNINYCYSGENEYCTKTTRCAKNLTCKANYCVKKNNNSTSSTSPSSPSTSSSPSSSSTKKNKGVACSNPIECSTGVCDLGICKQYTGGSCKNNKDCTSTNFCTAGYCQKKFVRGKTCDSNDFCESDKCYNRTCQ